MNHGDRIWCEEKIAASRSGWRLAALFSPPPQREVVTALLAFRLELVDCVENSSDHDLAHARLNWWREEITHSQARGTAQHPVTRIVQAAGLEAAPLNRMVRAAELELAGGPFEDTEAFRRYAAAAEGSMTLLAARAAGKPAEIALETAERLGSALALTRVLLDLGREARQGRVLLARDTLEAAGVTADQLAAERAAPALRQLVADQAGGARDTLAAWCADTGNRDQTANRIMAALARRQLQHLQRAQHDPLANPVRQGAFGTLFTAWRAARRSLRA